MGKTYYAGKELFRKYRQMDGTTSGSLLDYMQYGHAVIAFYKQNGKFKFVKATLRYYEAEFHKKYNPANVEAAVVYWDIDEQGWRTFQMENFLEWRVMG